MITYASKFSMGLQLHRNGQAVNMSFRNIEEQDETKRDSVIKLSIPDVFLIISGINAILAGIPNSNVEIYRSFVPKKGNGNLKETKRLIIKKNEQMQDNSFYLQYSQSLKENDNTLLSSYSASMKIEYGSILAIKRALELAADIITTDSITNKGANHEGYTEPGN